MRSVIRRFRLFILALLIPAYGLAAVGVAGFLPGTDSSAERMVVDGHGLPALLASLAAAEASGDADDERLELIFELGDTSDDISDHCVPHAVVARLGPPRVMSPLPVPGPRPDIWPQGLLRPPNGATLPT